MNVRVIEPPSAIVSYEEVKKHLRLDHDDDQTYVEALIAGATGWLDGPAGWLGRPLGSQVLELKTEGFGCYFDRLALPYSPVIEVISVNYLDVDDVERLVDADFYVTDGRYIWFRPTFNAPAVSDQPFPVMVRYRAGYRKATPDSNPVTYTNDVPAPIKVAIMMLVAQWYESRESVAIGATVETLPFAVDALLSPFRVFS